MPLRRFHPANLPAERAETTCSRRHFTFLGGRVLHRCDTGAAVAAAPQAAAATAGDHACLQRIKGKFWNPQGSTVLRDVNHHVGAGFELADRGPAGEPVGVFRDAWRRVIRDEHGHPWKG